MAIMTGLPLWIWALTNIRVKSLWSPWFRDKYALPLRHPVFGGANLSDKEAGLTFRQLGMVNRHRYLP
jgi:hypothetical protein